MIGLSRTKLNRNIARASQFADWLIMNMLELVLHEFKDLLAGMKLGPSENFVTFSVDFTPTCFSRHGKWMSVL